MAKKIPNYAVAFASRYADPVGGWLSAFVALDRLDALLEDARALSGHLDIATPPETRWAPWFGADIVSYYAVGYVTCLEWHARSRLVDLLSYKPNAATVEDVRPLKDSVIVEMISANVTVAGMIGAATNVSSLQAYMSIFDRVFDGVDVPLKSFAAIKDTRPSSDIPWVSGDEIDSLKQLFVFRNNLVHEINNATVGHPNIRDSWAPQEAIRMGELVARLIRSLEAALTRHAPSDFPNLLTEDGIREPRYKSLAAELPLLEARVENVMAILLEDRGEKIDPDWVVAKSLAKSHLEAEELFLTHTLMLHYRYEDLREPLKLALMKGRHAYLRAILQTVGETWGVEQESQDIE